jgi:leader peptidase (prepilin peptidase) / N-methyltransferase
MRLGRPRRGSLAYHDQTYEHVQRCGRAERADEVAPPSPRMTFAFVIALGLVIGSFLNVVIVRVPSGQNLLGRSVCPRCATPIAAHDNVPLVSFVLLRGRCRSCGGRISWRYPLVELSTAAALLAAFARFGLTPAFALASALLAALIAITAIDLTHQIIPNAITLPGIAVGLPGAPATGLTSWLDALLGVLVCGGLLFAVVKASGWFYSETHPQGGMGFGDVKLGAMLGAFLGWRLGLFALFVAVVAGGLVAAGLLLTGRKGRKDPVPFGPFLALGGATALLIDPPEFLGL